MSHTTPVLIPAGTVPLVRADADIIGADWGARREPQLAALRASMIPRGPCPICGHPTSDCTHEGAHRG